MSIDRIGTFANTQILLSQIQKSENALDTTNKQVASGNVSDTYSGYGQQTAVMEAARSSAARTDANVATAQAASTQLSMQDAQMSQLSNLASQVRQTLTEASANQDGTSLSATMEGYFDQAVQILNSKDGNSYLYGGDNNQTPPVTVNSLSDLAALPAVSQAFANGTAPTSVRIGDNQTVQVGMLASDVGTQLFSLFQQFAQFNQATPFDGQTSDTQQNFLQSSIAGATAAASQVNAQDAANGVRYQAVQDTVTQLQATSTVYKGFVSNIQDVDMAQAITQVNQNQVALQAAFQVTATLNQLSLLNYLPLPTS
jgi:flagellar hook-associated protein 3 FlgL